MYKLYLSLLKGSAKKIASSPIISQIWFESGERDGHDVTLTPASGRKFIFGRGCHCLAENGHMNGHPDREVGWIVAHLHHNSLAELIAWSSYTDVLCTSRSSSCSSVFFILHPIYSCIIRINSNHHFERQYFYLCQNH